MTHVTNFGLWCLWLSASLGLSFSEAQRAWSEVTGFALNDWACPPTDSTKSIIWADDLDKSNPTCPHCAVLCDMARGAE